MSDLNDTELSDGELIEQIQDATALFVDDVRGCRGDLLSVVKSLVDYSKRVTAERDALAKDKARLDWMETTKQSLLTIHDERKRWRTDGSNGCDIDYKFVGWTIANKLDECPTVRDAIDAAMKGDK